MTQDAPCCAKCEKEFPARGEGQSGPRVGLLYPHEELPKEIASHHEIASRLVDHLCGECWLSIMDRIGPGHF